MRIPDAPRVMRLERLLGTEILRGNCDRELAGGLLRGFLKFKFDFIVDGKGQLRWWLVTDEDYVDLWKKGLVVPNE